MQNYLTKSKYLSGLQCHKRLWYEKNYPERASSLSRADHRGFRQGKEVGERARELFPEGILIGAINPEKSTEQTEIAIRDGASCLFEASFVFENTWVRCDILQKDGDSWNLIEVKASTVNQTIKGPKIVKEQYLHDLAIQKYVLTGHGLTISKTQLMLINSKECVYPDLSNLFAIKDATDQVDSLMNSVPDYIETFKTILEAGSDPDVRIGDQCNKPRRCSFKGYCWEAVPEEETIFAIPRLTPKKKDELREAGIFRIEELPADYSLTDNQQAYVDYVLYGQPKIDTEAIKVRLSDLEHPIHFFDFETDNPPVPKFQGLRPYQHLPFQYSCHTWQSDGTVTHHEYLHTDTSDPRLPLVESLLDTISDKGSVIVYSTFESQRLEDLAEFLPQYAKPLRSIQSRLWDQWVIFRNHYKHPGFKGSNSLKSVLPVLVPSLRYDELDVQDGREAQAIWQLMLDSNSERERKKMIRNLKAYCKLDTQAMVEIHRVLLSHVREEG